MADLLRISGLDGLNAAPLLYGLDRDPQVALSLRPPAASASALDRGEADAALVPSIELARHPEWQVVPDLCIAARRRVGSVILVTTGPLQDLRSVAVDATSRTSVALLTILLNRRFGLTPGLRPVTADLDAMLEKHDGALLIADAALRISQRSYQVHDLAELWSHWTGLPFVFAVWATRPGLEQESVSPLLQEARRRGLLALPQLVARHATRNGNPGGPALTAYLGELLHYTLGDAEALSLQRFFAEARSLKLLTETPAGWPGEALTASRRSAVGGT